jgi:hypothetical protein
MKATKPVQHHLGLGLRPMTDLVAAMPAVRMPVRTTMLAAPTPARLMRAGPRAPVRMRTHLGPIWRAAWIPDQSIRVSSA